MKKMLIWMACSCMLMMALPLMATYLPGDMGMAACMLLFYVVNPLYCAAAGLYAGRGPKAMLWIPAAAPVWFLLGVYAAFQTCDTAFLLYAAAYLLIGLCAWAAVHIFNRKR